MTTAGYRIAIGLFVSLALCAAVQGRETPAAAREKVAFEITAPNMVQALMQFTEQSGLQLAFPTAGTDDLAAPRVVGQYTPGAALDQLLAGTGLRYEYANDRTISVRLPGGPLTAATAKFSSPQVRENARIQLAENAQGADASQAERRLASPSERPTQDQSLAIQALPEVLVRGSKSLNADIERSPDDIQPYVVLSREAIQNSGASTIDELMRTRLTMSYVPILGEQQGQLGAGNESAIALRGLDSSQTLILIDGRRPGLRGSVGGRTLQPDLNTIPLHAIERIEVLPATASGIYGGSATGGVVNVVLRRDYQGLESLLRYENTFAQGGEVRRANLNGGFSLEGGKTSVMFAASFADGTPLLIGDRNYTGGFSRRLADNLASDPSIGLLPLAATTNIGSAPVFDEETEDFVTPNLTLASTGQSLNSSITHVPTAYGGPSSDGGAAFVQSAGTFASDLANTRQAPQGKQVALIAPSISRSVLATVRRSFTDNIEGFLQLSGSQNYSRYYGGLLESTFFVPAGVAGNPFEQEINVTVPITVAQDKSVVYSDSRSGRALAGTIIKFQNDWSAEADFAFDRATFHQAFPASSFLDSFQEALESGTVDVFTGEPVDLSSYVVPASQVSPLHSTQRDATLHVAGPLWSMSGGPASVAALIEDRKNRYSTSTTTDFQTDGSSETFSFTGQSSSARSVSIESRLPLVSGLNQKRWVRALELQLAYRYDHYHVVPGTRFVGEALPTSPTPERTFHANSPTFGLKFSPATDVMLRMSYGRGFNPPALNQLNPFRRTTPFPAFFLGLTDPQRGGEPVTGTILTLSGGNADLRPERSTSKSAGIVLTPRVLPGLRVSFDWTEIEKRDNITSLALNQDLLNAEPSIPDKFTRAPTAPGDPFNVGKLTGFDARFTNIASARSASYDLAVGYTSEQSRFGTFEIGAAATRMVHNTQRVVSASPENEFAGTFSAPKWSANSTLTWSLRYWDVAWTTRYLDSFWFDTSHEVVLEQGAASIPSVVYHDVSAHWSSPAGRTEQSFWKGQWDIRGGIKNVFNREPRYYAAFTGLYDPWSDPRMATYYLVLSKEF